MRRPQNMEIGVARLMSPAGRGMMCLPLLKQLETKSHVRQLSPEGMCEVTAALDVLASSGREARGAAFTECEVVDFMLDLAEYANARSLTSLRLLEPSFGNGDFLLPAIRRLLQSWQDQRQPEFQGTSYLKRYDIFCQWLIQEQLYSTASVIASPRTAVNTGEYSNLSELTSFRPFVSLFAGHIATEVTRTRGTA